MRKSLVIVWITAFVGVGIVIGCNSSPAEEGDSDDPGRERANDDRDDSDGSGGSSGSTEGGAASCANHDPVDDRPACDQCARANCCESILACDKSPDCKAMMKCLEECAEGDLSCGLTCNLAHEQGAADLQQVGSCAGNRCAEECPSSTPDAGDGF